jgi:hypothetical protein
MPQLLNRKTSLRRLAACNFCGTVVTVVPTTYWPTVQWCGLHMGGG